MPRRVPRAVSRPGNSPPPKLAYACRRGFLSRRLRAPIISHMRKPLSLQLNGEARGFDGPLTVAGLLTELGLDTRKVAVERNLEIVPRSAYAEAWLASGDSLEIVHFIGGG